MNRARRRTLENFLPEIPSRIQMDAVGGCWLWEGATDRIGYGKVKFNKKTVGAHRASFLAHGGSLMPGQCVLHSCDVPQCINPSHLRAGSLVENAREAAARGRLRSRGRITDQEKHHVLRLKDEGFSQTKIASQVGIDVSTVRKIVTLMTALNEQPQ